MVKACTRCVYDAMSVQPFGDTPPRFFFRLDLHHAGSDDASAQHGRVVNMCCWPIGGGPDADLGGNVVDHKQQEKYHRRQYEW